MQCTIVCAWCHVQRGRVLSFGEGDKFQLGHGDGLSRTTPRVVAGVTEPVHRIAAGCVPGLVSAHPCTASGIYVMTVIHVPHRFTHAVAVGRTGGAWAWGSNKSGECGTGVVSEHVAVRRMAGSCRRVGATTDLR